MTPFIPIQLLLLSNQGKEVNYTMRLIRFSFQTYLKEYCTDTPKNIAQILQRLLHRYSNFFLKIAQILQRLLHAYSQDYCMDTVILQRFLHGYSKDYCTDTPKIIGNCTDTPKIITGILQRLLHGYSKDFCTDTPKIITQIFQ